MTSMKELYIDPERFSYIPTGIFVRARDKNGGFVSADISQLTKRSLLDWLCSRGGENKWAENTIGIILGYGPLHEDGSEPIALRGKQ